MRAISTLVVLASLLAAPAAAEQAPQPLASEAAAPEAAATTDAAPDAAAPAAALQNPVPHTRSSIQRGRMLYVRHCPICHGTDGKALIELISNATDLTAPSRWRYGTSEGEIFRSLRDGAGIDMPRYATTFENEEDLWHLVNYIRSLWPQAMRPPFAPEEPPLPIDEAPSDQPVP